jgi:hydroxymethylbilane synthase
MGDRDKSTPLPNLGKGLWTSELEAQLMGKELDLVVHCLKDMPTTLPAGCEIGCVTTREDPRDVVIFRTGQSQYSKISDLPEGSIVGTSSVRRAAQLRRRYPGLQFEDIRGNIDTRLAKLDAPDSRFNCIILAAAGLLRMDLGHRIAQYLDSTTEGGGMLYAVGQGALAIEIRDGDEGVREVLKAIEDRDTLVACSAERSVMRALEGGCSVPIGVETSWVGEGDQKLLRLNATVVSLDGSEAVDGEITEAVSTPDQAEALGLKLANELVEKGASRILDVINKTRGPKPPA